ncbi:MAG: adenylosuccinate synthase [Betaproteobacteria bacterium]|nr:adenylosuccinate synthase [Betaproteobacteria bacterium]
MSNIVLVGAQWGDEGKGKIVDLLSADIDVIVRFQGGNNAGHTLNVGGERHILHLVPSGILHPATLCLIGSGVVLDPAVFLEEVDKLASKGVDASPAKIKISNKTHLIMPYHKALDAGRELSLAGRKIGTTGRGIGPCYEDKVARVGLRAADLLDPDRVRAKIASALLEKNALLTALYKREAMDPDAVFAQLMHLAPRITPYLADVSFELEAAWAAGKSAMFEGAQGVHLDIDHGTYPFVTSSNTVAGNVSAGTGISMRCIDRVLGVVKAYTTRVGAGPFPVELFDATGDHLQSRGDEFGATTGRKRRCGWLDVVALRESVRLCGFTEFALTKLDVLAGLKEIHICTAYGYNGQRLQYPPQKEGAMAEARPIYETMPGFDEDITGRTDWEELPRAARDYVLRIEELTGIRVSIVSVGPERDQTIFR